MKQKSFVMYFSSQQKERKLLQIKRLDLDAAKTKLKKAKMAEARASVSYCFTPMRWCLRVHLCL